MSTPPALLSSQPPLSNIVIFANPIAGRGKGRRVALLLAEHLQAHGIHAATLFDPPASADPAVVFSADAAVVIGGDGTLRAVAGRYYNEHHPIPPLLPVPMGTANLMGRHLGIRWNSRDLPERVCQSIVRAELTFLDAAQANGQLFLLMAGVGIDGFIVHAVDRLRSGPIRYASYILPALLAFTRYPYTPIAVTLDGVLAFPSAPGMVFVGNIREYGTGFPILPNATPDDGLLDVCVIPTRSRGHVLGQFLRAAVGKHLQTPGVVYARAKTIDIQALHPVPMQIDGDPAGYTPVHMSLLPTRVPFIVPV